MSRHDGQISWATRGDLADGARRTETRQPQHQPHARGIAQGLGLALMEEYVPGRTENLHDYLIPTIGDMPDIEILLVEDGEPLGPFGAKGIGEPALVPTAPAIFNAVYDATNAAADDSGFTLAGEKRWSFTL